MQHIIRTPNMLTLGFAVHRPQHKIVSPPLIKQKPFPIFIANVQPKRKEMKPTYPHSNSLVKVRKVVACANTDEQLPEGLVADLMPKHVAVIMDGNRRWALQRRFPVTLGHHAGGKSLEKMARLCDKLGIKVLTVFAFSTENWSRPKEETDFLMEMVEESVKSDMEKAIGLDIRVSVIGNRSMFPVSLQETIGLVEEVTKAKLGLHVMGAANYGGRYDIMQACKSIAKKVKDGVIQLQDINEGLFEQELETKCTHFPNPDLLIRTSGEVRLSNFLLWQMAHTELFFVEKLFPEFGEKDFVDVLISYQERRRVYGD